MLPFVAMSILSACSSDEMGQIEQTPSSLPVNFHVRLKSFDAATRAAWKWADGSVVYLQFYNGENVVRGYAIYDESTESWSVPSWAGTLGSAGKCEFYFFDGVSTSGEDEVLLSTSTPVYADRSGSYTFDGSSITITGTLIPTTSRIRFSGAPDIKINISGITCYSSYDALTNRFESSSSDISLTVGTDGYTPYVYGVFTDANTRQLSITNSVDGENTLFVRAFPETSFQVGESGYVTIPFKNANRGWSVIEDFKANTLSFSANGVTFNMKFVKAGTFQMGSTSGDDDEQPVHQVTLTRDYYMGETEVTQALWYAVMGQSPTSDGSQWNSTYGQGDN